MALTPELQLLKARLERMGYASRKTGQDRMLAELEALDNYVDSLTIRKVLEESSVKATRMTSPGGDTCSCCGR